MIKIMAISFGKESKIGIVGAGAIGGITAALLYRAGYDIEVACNSVELAEKIISRGLHVFGNKIDFKLALPAVAHISQFNGHKDIILLATKANDMLKAAQEALPFLTNDSKVVCMQNGICDFALADTIGSHRTVGCIVNWGATMHEPGELELTASSNFILGNVFNDFDTCLGPLSEVLGTVFPVRISHNMMGHRYAKLIINACTASLGAVCGLYLGDMLAIRRIRKIMMSIVAECMSVADAVGIKVERTIGNFDYRSFSEGSGIIADIKRHLLIHAIGLRYRKLKSSSLSSLERGKRTEIDYLNGYVEAKGKEYNVPTPVNSKIVEIVKEIEDGRRSISLRNLDDPFFAGL